MSEKLCLQWNDFKENAISAFGSLKDDQDFSDVTLVCEDGQQVEAHKVILAASSPFFQNLLKKNKHPHPLIYMRGVQSSDLVAIIDFLYIGEANVYQENLDSFLAIGEELKLKGLAGQKSNDLLDEDPPNTKNTKKPVDKVKETGTKSKPLPEEQSSTNVKFERSVAIPKHFNNDLEELDKKVKSMMEKGKNMVTAGKTRTTAFICKACGKEGHPADIRKHIEANHLEGISIPCSLCEKVFSSRNAMSTHKSLNHKKLFES